MEATEPEPEPDPNAVTVTLNGREIIARKGDMVIAAAEANDAYVPHFCYHPRMTFGRHVPPVPRRGRQPVAAR